MTIKPHLFTNANTFTCRRTFRDMQELSEKPGLTETQRQLARQCRDLAAALHHSLTESTNG